MINYDKAKIKEALSDDNIFELLQDLGGEPQKHNGAIVSRTICHNSVGGSYKLYYYIQNKLFYCYSGCAEPSFDVFQLVIKVAKLQWQKDIDLNEAVRYVAQKFGLSGDLVAGLEEELEDWKHFANYDRIQEIELKVSNVVLKEYDSSILSRFNYKAKLTPWLKEGINQQAIDNAMIGYYPGENQITIPHFDKDGRFIGLRGRTLCAEDGEKYGKYRPLKVNQTLYSHPLGMNLYNLNNSKDNIKLMRKAIVFEGEKSSLKYQSYFGFDKDISVACCGSNITQQQVQLLLDAGAEEIVIAFDRQFQKIGDDEFVRLKENLIKTRNKYKNYASISFIFDKKMITGYKNSPIDCGPEKFLKLYKERIIL